MPRAKDFPYPGYDPATVPRHYETIDRYLARHGVRIGGPSPSQATDGGHSATSLHYKGRARDYGRSNCDCAAAVAALLMIPAGRLSELYYEPTNTFIKRGVKIAPSPGLANAHRDHIHASLVAGMTLDDLP